MEKQLVNALDDLDYVAEMLAKGRSAATFDGIHMVVWGGVSAFILTVQYLAEVKDWMPSSVLWLWQPIMLIAVVITLFFGRKSLIKRMRNPITRIYCAAFGAAGVSLFVFAFSHMSLQQPNAHIFSLLLCTSLASAFFVMGVATHWRHLLLASVGWWMGTAYFGFKGSINPIDFLILSGLLVLCVVLPGAHLMRQVRVREERLKVKDPHGV